MTKTTLKIDGMMCGHCEAHVNDAIRNHFSVKKVQSSHSAGETVIISDAPLEEEKIKSTIAETGYTLTGIHTEPYQKEGLFSFLKK